MGSQRAVRAQVIAALLAIAAPSAFADAKQDAQQHVAKASELHQAGKYREALAELTAAYQIDPQPGLLYAIAQVHVKLDECALAIDYYEQFLATHPDAKPSAAAHEAIDACKTVVAKQPVAKQPPVVAKQPPVVAKQPPVVAKQPANIATQPAKPVEPPPAAPVESRPALVEPPVEPKPAEPHGEPIGPAPERPDGGAAWYADPIADILITVGVGGGVASVLLYGSAKSDLDKAEQQPTYDAHKSLVDHAHETRMYAVIAGAGGAALLGIGVIRIVTHHDASTGIAVVPAGTGGLVTWSGRF